MKIRLRPEIEVRKMNTPYGLITHEWADVSDNSYIYKEMEVYQDQKAVIELEPVEEPVEEPKVEVIEEDIKIVEEPKPEIEPVVKKKWKKKR